MTDAKKLSKEQFGRTADAYATSAVHASGPGLAKMIEIAAPTGGERVLDVSTGAGHVALAFAPRVRFVVASDLAPEMLGTARRLADERRLGNVRLCGADADALPFASRSFDGVTCRIAAHHYPRLDAALREMARVLRPDGLALVEDNVAPDDGEADRFVNDLERLRDPSHFRSRTEGEWGRAFAAAGLAATAVLRHETTIEVGPWLARAGADAARSAAVTAMLREANGRVKEAVSVRDDPLRFSLRKVVWSARLRGQ
jgi:SAM-dependent methyltransferase